MATYCVTVKVLTATASSRPFYIPAGLRQGIELTAAPFSTALHSAVLHVAVEQENIISY
jgi:hypothetical protein